MRRPLSLLCGRAYTIYRVDQVKRLFFLVSSPAHSRGDLALAQGARSCDREVALQEDVAGQADSAR